jgi:hypothetical protein
MKRLAAARCLWGLALASAALASACAQIEPQVGDSQESCGESAPITTATGGNPGSGSTGTSVYGGASPATSPAVACVADAGSACDICESTYCCMTRLACYRDPVCFCADRALDGCMGGNGASAEQVTACLNVFSAHGTVERARLACQQAWCATECAAP